MTTLILDPIISHWMDNIVETWLISDSIINNKINICEQVTLHEAFCSSVHADRVLCYNLMRFCLNQTSNMLVCCYFMFRLYDSQLLTLSNGVCIAYGDSNCIVICWLANPQCVYCNIYIYYLIYPATIIFLFWFCFSLIFWFAVLHSKTENDIPNVTAKLKFYRDSNEMASIWRCQQCRDGVSINFRRMAMHRHGSPSPTLSMQCMRLCSRAFYICIYLFLYTFDLK